LLARLLVESAEKGARPGGEELYNIYFEMYNKTAVLSKKHLVVSQA
jgi:hypothetical protein